LEDMGFYAVIEKPGASGSDTPRGTEGSKRG